MADTGWKFPTATGAKHNDWTNPTNAYADDGNYTTALSTAAQKFQSYETFDFAIPVGSTIDGIAVESQAKIDAGGNNYFVYIWNNTASSWVWVGAPYSISSTETVYEHGGATAKFSASWVQGDFTDANFSIRIATDTIAGNTFYVDYIKVKVYYTEGTDYTLTCAVTDYTISFKTAVFTYAIKMTCAVTSYVTNWFTATLTKRGWLNLSKNTISPTNTTKTAISPTNMTKHTISPTNLTKNAINPNNVDKNTSTWTNLDKT